MNTHVHVLIGEHFIEITLACVTDDERRVVLEEENQP